MDHLITAEQTNSILLACDVPDRLHPLSASALEQLLTNNLPWEEFARLFTLPNSAYLPVADCLHGALAATATVASLM